MLWAVAVFWPLPLSAWGLSVASCLVSFLGSISVTPWPLSVCAVAVFCPLPLPPWACAFSLPVGGCGAFVRDRTLSRIARGHACDYLLLLPACGPWKRAGWPDVGHRRVWGPLSLSLLWPGAAAGVPPVLEGRPLPLSRLFFPGACQVRHELVWLLFPGSIWSLGGCDRFCSSVVGYRVSRFGCCWGGHFVCCDCDACWGWRFCLLLPLLFLACLVISSVRESPALAGVAVGRLVMGPTDVLRALQGKVSFFCPLFASSGGGAVALPQIRLWMTDLSLPLPVPGMRLEVRILVALPGILSARLVLGRRGLLQGLSLCQSGACLRPPRPSGVAGVDGSFTFAGFRLAWGGLGGFSVAYSLFLSVGKFAGPPRRGSGPDSSTRFRALLYWGASAWFLLLGWLLSRLPTGWRLAVFRAVAGCHTGIDGCRFSSPSGGDVGSFSYTLAFSRLTSVLSRCQILAWLVSWGRWLVLGWCLCLA